MFGLFPLLLSLPPAMNSLKGVMRTSGLWVVRVQWVPSLYRLDHVVVQSLSCVWLYATPWAAVCQASLSSTISWSLLKFMSIELVMLSTHVWLDHSKGQRAPIWQGCHEDWMSRECFLSCRGFLEYGQRPTRKPWKSDLPWPGPLLATGPWRRIG